MTIIKHRSQLIALALLLSSVAFSSVLAGWTNPVMISGGFSYMSRIAYANGILHALYPSLRDTIYYVRSTDLGQSWSTPIGISRSGSQYGYPQLRTSGDSVVASWRAEYNYVIKKSTDGGLSWSDTSSVLPQNANDIFDHNFCLSGRKIFFIYNQNYVRSNILFEKSTNFGNSWIGPRSVYSFYQLDNLELGNFGDTIFITMSGRVDSGANTEVMFLRSTNAGQNWSEPNIISLGDGVTSYLPNIAVNEQGELAVCWASEFNHPQISLRLSHDFGESWDPIITNTNFPGWVGHDINFSGDTLHLVSGGGFYILHTVSTDDGVTWAPVDSVEKDRNGSNNPALAISQGMIHVVWSDDRFHDPGIYYSRWEADYTPPDTLPPELNYVGNCHINTAYLQSSLSVAGNYAYCGGPSYEQPNMEIIDIADPTMPSIVSAFDSTYQASGSVVSGNYLYISTLNGVGLVIYDVSNPLVPILISTPSPLGTSNDICKKDSLIYIASFYYLDILNVANPFNPILVGRYHSSGPLAVAVQGDYAYALYYGRMDVIDISDPASPTLAGSFTTQFQDDSDDDIAVSSNYAYIAGAADIEIVDISNPAHPVRAGNLSVDYSHPYRLYLYNDFLLVAHWYISVYDISNAGNPMIAARYSGPLRFYAVTADDQYIYARTIDSFFVFQLPAVGIHNDDYIPQLPQKSYLSQNYPNPFNAQTTISYSLPQSGLVTLSVYNIMGQKVATLVDGVQQAGEHKVVWDASAVTSGVYFYRLSGAGISITDKMVLLR